MRRSIDDIEKDIRELRAERKLVEKEFGKGSVEYAELTEELDGLEDSLEFHRLHY